MFIVSLFLLLALMSYQANDPVTGRSVFSGVIFSIFSPAQRITAAGYDAVANTISTYFDLVNTNRENARLQAEVAELKIKFAIAAQEERENQRLRRILELKEKTSYQLIVAEVTGTDAKLTLSETISVNRGSRHGLRVPMAVVTPAGVVGITMLTQPFSAKVQLITDASASIGAMLHGSRIAGILAGAGSGRCILRFLPVNTVLKKGDLVVTSGQDGIFPEGLPVGRVSQQLDESESYRSAEVMPFQNFSSLDEVTFLFQSAVITPQPPKTSEPESVRNQ